MNPRFRHSDLERSGSFHSPEGEVVEIPLLLPNWEVKALETAAHGCGLTAGEMVRQIVRAFIAGMRPSQPDAVLVASSNDKTY
jgi:hypothetical protein